MTPARRSFSEGGSTLNKTMPMNNAPKLQDRRPARHSLSDGRFTEFERLANVTIHELVYACHHAEDDQLEEAADGLITASGNIDQLQTILAHAERRASRLNNRSHPFADTVTYAHD